MTTTIANKPHGILYNHDPSITVESLRATYRVPTADELRDAKEQSRRATSRSLPDNLGSRWQPVHHADWIDAVHGVAGELGLVVADQKFALSADRHDLFALFEMESDQIDRAVDHVYKVFALRTSNMQRRKSEGRTGGRVHICSNGIMTGEFLLGHKQTKNLDPVELVRDGFGKWVDQQTQLDRAVAVMKDRTLSASDVFELLGRAMIGYDDHKGFISAATARRIVDEYEQPRHECFRDRNAWSLYNAATEVMKHEARMSNDVAERLQLGMAKLLVPDVRRN